MMRKFFFGGALLAAMAACGGRPRLYEATSFAMGTVVTARAYAADEATARRAVEAALAAVAEAEKVASYEDPASELSALNAFGTRGPVAVSPALFELISLATDLARATDGYFDPTVGPVVELYGIKGDRQRWPGDDEVAAALAAVGYEKLILDKGRRAVIFGAPAMKLDLSAVAKGWAVDRAAAAMAAAGARAGIVEAGGEVACFGGDPGRRGGRWRIGVDRPRGEGLYATFGLAAGACATSGDYRQRYEVAGHRFSHLFDARTGRPAAAAAGVTVVASSCAVADAWATALAVAPPAAVPRLLKRPGAPGGLIIRERRGKLYSEIYGDFPEITAGPASE